jgi:hypothetical protein
METSACPNNEFENEDMSDTFLDLYNKEIDHAEAEIDSGDFLFHSQVEKLLADRRTNRRSY